MARGALLGEQHRNRRWSLSPWSRGPQWVDRHALPDGGDAGDGGDAEDAGDRGNRGDGRTQGTLGMGVVGDNSLYNVMFFSRMCSEFLTEKIFKVFHENLLHSFHVLRSVFSWKLHRTKRWLV